MTDFSFLVELPLSQTAVERYLGCSSWSLMGSELSAHLHIDWWLGSAPGGWCSVFLVGVLQWKSAVSSPVSLLPLVGYEVLSQPATGMGLQAGRLWKPLISPGKLKEKRQSKNALPPLRLLCRAAVRQDVDLQNGTGPTSIRFIFKLVWTGPCPLSKAPRSVRVTVWIPFRAKVS